MPSSSPGLPSDQHKKLFDACRNGNILQVKKLFSKSKSDIINCRDSQGRNSTPLHLAAGYNNIDVAEFLLTIGANVNASDKGGLIPLHNAASYGHLDLAALLLKHNSQVNATDSWGFTPLHEAAQKGRVQLCALLLKHGANPYLKTNDNQTALDLASAEDVKSLLREAMTVKTLGPSSSSTKTNLKPKITRGSTIPSSSTSRLASLIALAPSAPIAPSAPSLASSPTVPTSSTSPSTSCLTPPTPSAPSAPLSPSAPTAPSAPCKLSSPTPSSKSPVSPTSSSSPQSPPSSSSSSGSSSSPPSSTSSSSCSPPPNGNVSVNQSGEIVAKSIAYDIIDINIVNNNNKTDKKSTEPIQDSTPSTTSSTPSSRNNNTNNNINCNITIDENATSSKGLSTAMDCTSNNHHQQLPVPNEANLVVNKDVKCLICEENNVNIRFYPCNHSVCCSDCSLRMKRCITCKQVIEKLLTLETEPPPPLSPPLSSTTTTTTTTLTTVTPSQPILNGTTINVTDHPFNSIMDHSGVGASSKLLATSPPTRIYGPFYSSTTPTTTLLNNNLHSIKSEIDLNIPDPIQRLKYLESKIMEIAEAIQCGICLESTKNVIFLCGHGCCAACSSTLITCHMCRKTITKKINIY